MLLGRRASNQQTQLHLRARLLLQFYHQEDVDIEVFLDEVTPRPRPLASGDRGSVPGRGMPVT